MVFKEVLLVDESDIRNFNHVKGKTINYVLVPKKLKDEYMNSELHKSLLPMTSKFGDILFYENLQDKKQS